MTLRKTVISILLPALLLLALVSGLLLYYLTHPGSLKPVLEKQLSRTIGARVEIETLSYTLSPLSIEIRGLSLGTESPPGPDLSAAVSFLKIDMDRTGGFADKTLVLNPELRGFSLTIGPDFDPLSLGTQEQAPSFLSKRLADLVGVLFFQKIRVKGLCLEQGEIQAALKGFTARLHEVSAHLTDQERLLFSGRGSLFRPEQGVRLLVPWFELTTSSRIAWSDPFLRATFAIEQGMLQTPDLEVASLKLALNLAFDHSLGLLRLNSLELDVNGLKAKHPLLEGGLPKRLQIQSQARIEFGPGTVALDPFFVSANKVFKIQGGLFFENQDQTGLRLRIAQGVIHSEQVWASLSRALGERLKTLEFEGPVHVQGDVHGLAEEAGWEWRTDVRLDLPDNNLILNRDQMSLRTGFQGEIRIQGELPLQLNLSGEIRTDKTRLSSNKLVLEPFATSLSFSGEYPQIRLETGRAEIPRATLDVAGSQLVFQPLGLDVTQARIDIQEGSLQVSKLRLRSQLFETMLVSLTHDRQKTTVELQTQGPGLSKVARSLNLLPKGWTLQASENLWLNLSRERGRDLFFSTRLGIQDMRFENGPGSLLGEGLQGALRTRGRLDLESRQLSAKTQLDITQGEALLDRFYFNLSRHALSFSGSLDYTLGGTTLNGLDLRVSLKDLLRIETRGRLDFESKPPKGLLEVRIPKTAMKPVFQTLVQEPFKMEHPAVLDLKVEGDLEADLRLVSSKDSWKITGQTRVNIEQLATPGAGLKGLRLTLPLRYQSITDQVTDNRLKGRLALKGFGLPWLPKQGLQWELTAGPNELRVEQATRIQTPGGEVRLGPLWIANLLPGPPRIQTSLNLNGFRLGPVFEPLLDHPVQGRLSGGLKRIVIADGSMQTSGSILAEVLDGRIRFYDIEAKKVFSPLPVLRLSCELSGLNLAPLTTGTSFGKIQGVLKGSVRNLEIAAGQPQAFDLHLETVKTKSVAQRISVKAVDNIARIGGGQSPFMGFAGTFAALFKNFSYKKIGVRASLENDRFRINGTIREQGTEYLVRKAGLTGVNIVNSNPDNLISFKDMVKRIKRVTGSEGPVRGE